MSTSGYEGITFVSSLRGWRYDRVKQHLVLTSIAGWILVSDYIQFDELAWDTPIVFVLVWMVMSWLMRGIDKRRVFGARVEIREEHLEVVDEGVPSSIPWKDLLYIRIDRSPSGHRRNVRIRARGGKLFTLLDPEDGELLESWALEVASAKGIKVKVRKWMTLNAEPVWTVLMYALVLAVVEFAGAGLYF